MLALNDEIASRIVPCAAEICWRQWRSLAATGLPIGERPVTAIVDPEALVLLSLVVCEHERRLDDQLRWWASAGCSLMSVQRMRTLLDAFPARLRDELARFAAMAVDAGDHRWKVFVGRKTRSPVGRPGKGPRELQLVEPPTLMLRLRAGFGVGAKADLLTFLIGAASARNESEVWATAEIIAKATSYSVASTRRAASDMVLGRFVDASADRPVHYSVNANEWGRLLDLRDPFSTQDVLAMDPPVDVPPWRFWSQMFAFLAACIELGSSPLAEAAPVVQASHMRDLTERFRRPLAWNGIEWIDPRMFPGERYVEAFGRTLAAVIAWIEEHA